MESGIASRRTYDTSVGRGDRLRASAGLALAWGGLQVAGILGVASVRRGTIAGTPALILAAVAAGAVGWTLLGGGRIGPAAVRATLAASRHLWWGLVVGSLGVIAAVPVLNASLGTSSLAVVAPPAQLLLVAGAIGATWTRTAPVPPGRPWAVPSAALAAFVATSLVTSGLALDDIYPLSRYPMYSAPRVGQYEVAEVTFDGVAADGSPVRLGRPASRQVLLRLAADEDVDRLSELAVQLAGDRYDRVVVTRVASAITRHPDPVGLEVLDRHVVVEVDIPRAGAS